MSGRYHTLTPEKFWFAKDAGAEQQIAERTQFIEELRRQHPLANET